MRLTHLCSVLIGAAAIGWSSAGHAHGIQSSLERLGSLSASGGGSEIQLETSFSNGTPAHDASVSLIPVGGEGPPIAVGHTDAMGQLTFKLPPVASGNWEIQVDAGPGHRDYLEIPPGPEPGAGPVKPTAAREVHPAPLGRGPWAPLVGLGLLSGLLALGSLKGRH